MLSAFPFSKKASGPPCKADILKISSNLTEVTHLVGDEVQIQAQPLIPHATPVALPSAVMFRRHSHVHLWANTKS